MWHGNRQAPQTKSSARQNGIAPRDKLPDLLADGLKIIFVGTAAGRRSTEKGAYYAHPSNRFWRALWETGLTPRLFAPDDFRDLLPLGFGLTDISKAGVGTDNEIGKAEFDVPSFTKKIQRYRPLCVAFTSKKSASLFFPKHKISYGQLGSKLPNFPEIFVLPSTSGQASRYWDLSRWQQLADWYRRLDANAAPR